MSPTGKICVPRGKTFLERPLSFQNKLRRNTMLTIPLALIAASIGASIYMGFVWRPPQPKRVRHFFHDVHGNVTT
jgi:hypothetical protein